MKNPLALPVGNQDEEVSATAKITNRYQYVPTMMRTVTHILTFSPATKIKN